MAETHIAIPDRQRATLGIYFHIPFCPHLCPYCDFIKTDKFSRKQAIWYFEWLLQELKLQLENPHIHAHKAVTVFFGGGTPGIFWGSSFAPLLKEISSRFEIEECTIECNPGLVSRAKIESWKDVGIDRLTLGAQSLDPAILQFLGRMHSEQDVARATEWGLASGMTNIQADIIYGLPVTFRGRKLRDELDRLASMGVSGFSAYCLTVEDRTAFSVSAIRADDDLAADEYAEIRECAARYGFVRRETSNFSKFECKHNNVYWYGMPYIGIGVGAHGFLDSGLSPESEFGERYRYGLLSNSSERKQAVVGRDEMDLLNTQSPWLEMNREGPRSWREMFNELTFSLLRTPGGIPGQWLAFQGDAYTAKVLMQNPSFSAAARSGKIEIAEDGSIRLAHDEYLMGDYWHRVFVSASGTL
jgi:oxygen-independent coproporphyrinogen-3 oxidase